MLRRQYRMRSPIARVVSSLSYAGRLLDDSSVETRNDPVAIRGSRLVLLDTSLTGDDFRMVDLLRFAQVA